MENKILDRSKPPLPGKPRDLEFPEYFETVTANGITVLVVEDNKLPIVTTRFVFKRGGFYDNAYGSDCEGLSSLTVELMTKGTRSYSAEQLSDIVDYLGGGVSTGSGYDATYVSGYSLAKNFDELFEIVSEVINEPAFSEDEIEREKEHRINDLISYKDDSDYLANVLFKRIVFGKHPYGFQIEGTENSVAKFEREHFVSFHSDLISPSNIIVAFVGNITPMKSVELIEKNFSTLFDKTTNGSLQYPDVKSNSGIFLTTKKGAVQSSIKVGHPGVKRDNPDYIKINLMNVILGGSFTSRINQNLRETHGYTYGAKSAFEFRKYSGEFSVETDVKNSLSLPACKEILFEIQKLREEKVDDDELANVKNYITGNFPLQLETPNSVATKLINLKLYDLPENFYDTYISDTIKVTSDEILDTARRYLKPEELSYCIAGNPDEIFDDMKQLGNVSVINL